MNHPALTLLGTKSKTSLIHVGALHLGILSPLEPLVLALVTSRAALGIALKQQHAVQAVGIWPTGTLVS